MTTTDPAASQKTPPREHKDLRLRKQHFPNAENLVFDRKKAFVKIATSFWSAADRVPGLSDIMWLCSLRDRTDGD